MPTTLFRTPQAGVYDDPFELADRQYRQQQSAAALDGNDTTTGAGMQVHPALQAPPTATQTPGAPGSTTVSPAVSPGMWWDQGVLLCVGLVVLLMVGTGGILLMVCTA